jgi:hypothetical protein
LARALPVRSKNDDFNVDVARRDGASVSHEAVHEYFLKDDRPNGPYSDPDCTNNGHALVSFKVTADVPVDASQRMRTEPVVVHGHSWHADADALCFRAGYRPGAPANIGEIGAATAWVSIPARYFSSL